MLAWPDIWNTWRLGWCRKHEPHREEIYQNTYNQLQKYWDIDRILIYLALHTTTINLKLTEEMCFNCRLAALIWGYLHPNQLLELQLPLVKGSKRMGQSPQKLFYGHACFNSSLFNHRLNRQKVWSWFQGGHLHLESVADNCQDEMQRAVTINKTNHHQAEESKQSHHEWGKIKKTCGQINCLEHSLKKKNKQKYWQKYSWRKPPQQQFARPRTLSRR